MGIQAWFGIYGVAPARYVELENMTQGTDEQGGGWVRSGTYITAVEQKLSTTQVFFAGRENINAAFRFYADSPLEITEHDRLWHPTHGELDIITVLEDIEEGVVQLDCVDLIQGEGQ